MAVTVLTIALMVSAAALFLTFSKSAYLATAGGVVTFFLLLATTWRRRASIVLISVALSAFVVPWPAVLLQASPPLENAYSTVMIKLVGASRYNSWNPAMLSGRGSLVERLLATEAAVHMAADHPTLGIGLDQFKSEYVDGYKTPQAHLDLDSAHTFWPEVAAELGIPALLFVVLIFAAALLALWRVYRAPPDQFTRILALTLLASLIAWLLVATAFAGDMYRPWRNMSSDFVMMAVLVAAAFALSRMAGRGRQPVAAESDATTSPS
jgi:O-antigen ligase